MTAFALGIVVGIILGVAGIVGVSGFILMRFPD
jgi:hypothetical protein